MLIMWYSCNLSILLGTSILILGLGPILHVLNKCTVKGFILIVGVFGIE